MSQPRQPPHTILGRRGALVLRAGAVAVAGLAILKAAGVWTRPDPSPRALAAAFLARAGESAGGVRASQETLLFTDVAASVGVAFVHDNGARGNYWFPELVGPGGAFLDFDNDGDLDIFLVGGGPVTAEEGEPQRCRLYRNDAGRFTDVSVESGADTPGPGMGVACADYDDDGDIDILVTRVGPNALLRNDGQGRFEEVAAWVGVDDAGWGTSAVFFDYDRDGRLDLYVCNYVLWSPQLDAPCQSNTGARDYCGPMTYASSGDKLYRNLGRGRFEDVSDAAGISLTRGNGLGVVACDFDGDGWEDLYVANDQVPAMLWHNNGDGTFEDRALITGCAYDSNGIAIAGMGLACEDLDDDGDFDLLVTNIRDQTDLVLINDGDYFRDVSLTIGAGARSIPVTSFGVVVFDQDHDGRLDAYFANGAVTLGSPIVNPDNPYAQPDHFARFVDGRIVDATAGSGVAFADVGRGAVTGDYDGDGDLDILLTNNRGPARLLRNNNAGGNHWLIVDARSGPGRRTAVGAAVSVTVGGRTQHRGVRRQQSYLNSGDGRVHFGLGGHDLADRVEVRWIDGTRTVHEGVPANTVLTIVREESAAEEIG